MPVLADVFVTSLTATPGFGQVVLTWTTSDPGSVLAAVELWMSKTNDRSQAGYFGEGLTGFTNIQTPQAGSSYYWTRARTNTGTWGPWFPLDANSGVQSTANNIPNLPGTSFTLVNGSLVASVAANALTVAVKTAAGADPSTSDPVFVSFRNPSLALGGYQVLAITAPLSVTAAAGNSIGAPFGTSPTFPFRVWVLIINNGGTPALGLVYTGRQLALSLNELDLVSASASASTFQVYASSTITSKPYRLAGYLDFLSGLATLGNWVVPDTIGQSSQASPKPGQALTTFVGSANAFGWTTTIPFGASVPTSGQGTDICDIAFGSKLISLTNQIDYEAVVSGVYSVDSIVTLALFRSGVANAIASSSVDCFASKPFTLALRYIAPIDPGAPTYNLRIGAAAAGTGECGAAGTNNMGNTRQAIVIAREVMG